MSEHQLYYRPFISGKNSFISEYAVDYYSRLETALPEAGIPRNSDYDGFKPDPQAYAEWLDFCFGVMLGAAIGWPVKTALDEVYKNYVRPIAVEFFKGADAKFADHPGPRLIRHQVEIPQEGITIIFAAYGNTFEEANSDGKYTEYAHGPAIEWAKKNSDSQKVQLYFVHRGKVNVTPFCFDSVVKADEFTHTYIREQCEDIK